MRDDITRALERDQAIDITTTGRRSGEPRRIEIWFHLLDGHVYLTGLPGRRDWYANLLARPAFTFHLKQSVEADLDATARPVVDAAERRRVLEPIVRRLGRASELGRWLDDAPLVAVELAAA